ncbi:hypothetical protein X975_08562, partial [Stegodyphus mimosarum]
MILPIWLRNHSLPFLMLSMLPKVSCVNSVCHLPAGKTES